MVIMILYNGIYIKYHRNQQIQINLRFRYLPVTPKITDVWLFLIFFFLRGFYTWTTSRDVDYLVVKQSPYKVSQHVFSVLFLPLLNLLWLDFYGIFLQWKWNKKNKFTAVHGGEKVLEVNIFMQSWIK